MVVALATFFLIASPIFARDLTFEERVKAQEAIERVYYSHQIGATIPFEDAIPREEIEGKVQTYLRQSVALEKVAHVKVTAEMLREEMVRISSRTRMPERLREIYTALEDDPFLIAECIARPALVHRLSRSFLAVPMKMQDDGRAEISTNLDWQRVEAVGCGLESLPDIARSGTQASSCLPDDTWDNGTFDDTVQARELHTAVWTGSLMIVWGGSGTTKYLQTGARYDPATDSWSPASTLNAPSGRESHAAVWTGSAMIVWGGFDGVRRNTGGRYDPVTDTWTPTSTVNAPIGRDSPSAVWTGSRMVVWGGSDGSSKLNTGGRYDPATDTWTPTSTIGAPGRREAHTAVWTGSRMIVWGGTNGLGDVNTGGSYDPASDSWTATTTFGAPTARRYHTTVWTGSRMIVWGGTGPGGQVNTGSAYDPLANAWTPSSVTDAPASRYDHSAVWTGNRMVVWGGRAAVPLSSGGRYDPAVDSWTATSELDAPSPRYYHTAVWNSGFMIVWGGSNGAPLNSGGRYALGQSIDDDGDGASECAGDCNDDSVAVHPGAVEICDRLDNDCNGVADDGIVPPSGTPLLILSKSGSETVLSWSPISEATAYDAVEGDVATLSTSSGDFTSAVLACILDDGEVTSIPASSTPAPGTGSWYLVRPVNCAGDGTYDEGTGSQQGSRDAEINASPYACP